MPDKNPPAAPAPPPSTGNPWLDRVPALEEGRRFPSMPPDAAAKLFDELLAGGPSEIRGIIDTLGETDDGKDWRTRFVLHALASHTGDPERAGDRRKLEAIYAAALAKPLPTGAKTFLCRQLQHFAGAASVPALADQIGSPDPMLSSAALAALTAIGQPAVKALAAARPRDESGAVAHALQQIGAKAR